MTTSTETESLTVSRLIKAPRARVFTAWTTPNELLKWMGGEHCNFNSAKLDLRVGGAYEFRVGQEGEETVLHGKYRDITPVGRLVFTLFPGVCSGALEDIETLATVDLAEQKGGTLLAISHAGFISAELRDKQIQGWTGSLDKLEKLA